MAGRDAFQSEAQMHLLERLPLDEDAPMNVGRASYHPRHTGDRLSFSEIPLDETLQPRLLEIARDGNHNLRRVVVRLDIAQQIGPPEVLNRILMAQDRPA